MISKLKDKFIKWLETEFFKLHPEIKKQLDEEEAIQKLEKSMHRASGRFDPETFKDADAILNVAMQKSFQRDATKDISPSVLVKDSNDIPKDAKKDEYILVSDNNGSIIKDNWNASEQTIPSLILSWYASQGFIGYSACALLAQHWLIDKACTMPAEDSVRKGFEYTINDGTEVAAEIKDEIKKLDVKYRLNHHLVEFLRFGRIFGIRIAMFVVESNDPDYYFKPFNPDGITPGSYKGIVQIEPYWVTPELDGEAAAFPGSLHFYEPTWWRIAGGMRVHRSHLILMRPNIVSDILKPTYYYGGVSIPQKIFERVYAAERIANEAPELALTKRTLVQKIDIENAVMKSAEFQQRMNTVAQLANNSATRFIGIDDEFNQFDTSLTDLDGVIMTQYQIVAAASNVPATKLLGTTPKGFNATGEYEEKSYHEFLESNQEHFLTPLIERHHMLLLRSEICPKYNIKPFNVDITWNPLASLTAEQEANVNKIKAETGQTLVSAGAILPEEERARIINDPKSGYDGIPDDPIETDPNAEGEYSQTEPDEDPEISEAEQTFFN